MRLDESLPRPLADLLTGHDARTVTQMAWTSLSNGALLRQAAGTFDALLTADQSIEFQQNLKTLPMAVKDARSRRCLMDWRCPAPLPARDRYRGVGTIACRPHARRGPETSC